FLHEDFYVTTGAFASGGLPSSGHPLEDRGRRFFTVFARVSGSVEQARALVAAAGARLEALHPDTNRGRRAVVFTESEVRRRSDRAVAALAFAMIAVTILIAAITVVNFAGLLLIRAHSRTRDRAIRSA